MSRNYIVTCKPATAVTQSVVLNFTGADDLNLILSKISRLELYEISNLGLRLQQELALYGRIINITPVRLKTEERDSLFVVTERFQFAILAYKNNDIVTRVHGDLNEIVGRIAATGVKVMVDPWTGMLAVRCYEGKLQVVQWDDSNKVRVVTVKMPDIAVIDLTFVKPKSGIKNPCLAYIYQNRTGRHLRVAEVNVPDMEMTVLGNELLVESAAERLIPTPSPCGGVIIVGLDTITHADWVQDSFCTITPTVVNTSRISAVTAIGDGHRFLMSGKNGELLVLIVDVCDETVRAMQLDPLGRCSYAESLAYIDNGVVFVGSRYGDSQLIRLNQTVNEQGSFVSVLETFPNIGPIRDMIVQQEENGQSYLVTSSGMMKDGTLRVIRNGVGIEEKASVNFDGIKAVYPLRLDESDSLDSHLFVCTTEGSRLLLLDGEELEEVSATLGMDLEARTLYVGTFSNKRVVQITTEGIILIKHGQTYHWKHPNGKELSTVAVDPTDGTIISVASTHAVCLKVDDINFNVVGEAELPNEVACVTISPADEQGSPRFCAFGYWQENNVEVRTVPDLRLVAENSLAQKVLPRCCLICQFDSSLFLLVALGNGSLYYFVIASDGSLHDGNRATLGTVPLTLYPFETKNKKHVFACSDRPVIIYASGNKLLFSNVNLKLVNYLSPLHSEAYQNCLVICEKDRISIGRIDDVEKLHIRSVPLGESPSRIAYIPSLHRIALIVSRDCNADWTSLSRAAPRKSKSFLNVEPRIGVKETDRSALVILDANTYEVLHAHDFDSQEEGMSLAVGRLGDDPTEYIMVGTAHVTPLSSDCKKGRLIIFEAGPDRNALKIVYEMQVLGAVLAVSPFLKNLICTINSSVRILAWHSTKELTDLSLETSCFQFILAIHMKTRGDIALVGDLMRSMSVMTYGSDGKFHVSDRELESRYTTAIEIIDADTFVAADTEFNLVTVERDKSESTNATKVLQVRGRYYTGEFINCIVRGALVTRHVEGELTPEQSFLMGTSEGAILAYLTFDEATFKFLVEVERAVVNSRENALRITHAAYRAFSIRERTLPTTGFVDGDVVESLLALPREEARNVISHIRLPKQEPNTPSDPDGVLKLVEEISRMH